MRQLFARLDAVLRAPQALGERQRRSLEHHRERIVEQLVQRGLDALVPQVARLPRRYILARSPTFIARHLSLVAGSDVRIQARRHRPHGVWEVLIVARDRPGLLATFAGVLALRGATVLAADAATCSDGLVLDVFTVASAYGLPLERSVWSHVEADLAAALDGRLPLEDLLGARPPMGDTDIRVRIDNSASQFFSVVEVHAPDEVGLLYRITSALSRLGLDIHHAKIATHAERALDVFYVWDLAGNKLDAARARELERDMLARLAPAYGTHQD
jgi:[protein-PII] uridylyltransferase